MHHDAQRLVAALKRTLRRDGVTYAELARRIGLSEASVKRLFSRGGLTLDRLARICAALEIDMAELVRTASAHGEHAGELSLAQERALAEDPRLLLLFHLLLSGWNVAEIGRGFDLDAATRTLLLARLDRLGLIELLPNDRVRVRAPRQFVWRRDGPIQRRYGAQALGEFLDAPFADERSLLRFEVRELSEASLQVLRRKLERIAQEAAELAEIDSGLPGERKRSVGMAVALRPWVFSLARALKIEP